MTRQQRRWLTLLLVLVTVVGLGAGLWVWRSPEMRVRRHAGRADRYYAQQQYREAALEYRNVLQVRSDHPRAIRQLGLAHYHLGELGHAIRYLPRAREADPSDVEVRVTVGAIYLLARRPDLARQEAEQVLAREPRNLDALLLVAGSAFSPDEVAAALTRLAAVRDEFAGKARYHIAVGGLYLRAKNTAEAERAFRAAVAAEPSAIEAHAVLGDYYVSRKDVAQAEQAYRAAAGLAPSASVARLSLVDFYLATGKRAEARQVLDEITKGSADFLPGWRRLAELEFAEGKHDAALAALDVIFKKSPSDFGALMLRGRVRLARRELGDAVADFQKVLKLEPKFALARYHLALAYRAQGNLQYARSELREATQLAPNFSDAVLALAELDVQSGAPQPAIDALQKLLVRTPNDTRALTLLGSAWLAKGDAAKAGESYQKVAGLAPNDPRSAYFLGRGLRAQGKLPEARKQFELALERAPGFLEPLNQLVAMAFAEKRMDLALERVQKEITRVPKSAGLHVILAAVHLQRGERAQGEAAYKKALELNESLLVARLALAQIYAESNRFDLALAELERARQKDPRSVGVYMLTGLVHERRNDVPGARQAYEQALALNPRHALAANNLAYIYSEHGGDKERALHLAQTAKELAPDDPQISDTLGWILYKRGLYQRARALLKESVTRLPDNAEVQYHFGMASWKAGDTDGAKTALRVAANSSRDFPGRDEARKTLNELR